MEIEFNPSRAPQPGYTPPVARPNGPAAATPQADSTTTTDLDSQLQQVPLVRADKVMEARKLLADEKYPPDDVLDRLAVLLAIHLQS